MLIQFTVKNFRSLRKQQTFSLVASNSTFAGKRNLIKTSFSAAPILLEVAAIYGANGSGKSTLIDAFEFMQGFVEDSHKQQPGEKITGVAPYFFSKKTVELPSSFELVFISDGFLFQYGFVVDAKKVHDEWLFATPSGMKKQKQQTWFKRHSQDMTKSKVKRDLRGAKEAWKEGTGDNQLFLSVSANRQSVDFKKPFSWIRNNLRMLTAPQQVHPGFTSKLVLDFDKKSEVLLLLNSLDLFVDDLSVAEKTINESDLLGVDKLPPAVRAEIVKSIVGSKQPIVKMHHAVEEGGFYQLPIEQESSGTQQLYALAGPLLDVFEKGLTLVVDEIHNSLHPLALKKLVSLFNDPSVNIKNAQLIFTTHDVTAMDYLSRDQVWFIEKDKFDGSTLTPLDSFQGSKNEPVAKRYLGGRYGAIPNIGNVF
jgi:uncharacterized protein